MEIDLHTSDIRSVKNKLRKQDIDSLIKLLEFFITTALTTKDLKLLFKNNDTKALMLEALERAEMPCIEPLTEFPIDRSELTVNNESFLDDSKRERIRRLFRHLVSKVLDVEQIKTAIQTDRAINLITTAIEGLRRQKYKYCLVTKDGKEFTWSGSGRMPVQMANYLKENASLTVAAFETSIYSD